DDVKVQSTVYQDGFGLRLTGSGFVEGAQTLILGTAIGAGGATEVPDVWDFAGPDAFDLNVNGHFFNTSENVDLPSDPPTGPIKLRTLGGSSEPWPVFFTGFATGTE